MWHKTYSFVAKGFAFRFSSLDRSSVYVGLEFVKFYSFFRVGHSNILWQAPHFIPSPVWRGSHWSGWCEMRQREAFFCDANFTLIELYIVKLYGESNGRGNNTGIMWFMTHCILFYCFVCWKFSIKGWNLVFCVFYTFCESSQRKSAFATVELE